MTSRTIGVRRVSAALCVLCLLWVAILALPVAAAPWQQINPPANGEYCSALTPGQTYLYAAWCTDADSALGVFRTPIATPGPWELLGIVGKPTWDILVDDGGSLFRDELVFVAAQSDTCIYRSIDGGQHWESGEGGLSTLNGYALAWNGGSPGYLYATAGETYDTAVYRSTDLGNSWTRVSTPESINGKPHLAAPRDGSALVYRTVWDITWTPNTYRSTNAGGNWTWIGFDSEDLASHDLDFRPEDPLSGCALLGNSEIRRWRTGEDLPMWVGLYETIGVEMPGWAPECTFTAGKDSAGRLQAAWRTWGSSAWIPMNDGFPSEPGSGVDWLYWDYHLKAAPGMPRLFYATHGDGLWVRDVDDVLTGVEDSAPAPLMLGPVRPNPAAGPVTFQLEGAMAGATAWRVFDAAGRCVFRAPAGADRSLAWDGRQADGRAVPAGVYWVRADLPGRSITRSFVICR